MNLGGLVLSVGKSASGSPLMSLTIRNFSGSSPRTGFVLSATGLYFFLVWRLIEIGSESRDGSCDSVTEGDVGFEGTSVVEAKAGTESRFLVSEQIEEIDERNEEEA